MSCTEVWWSEMEHIRMPKVENVRLVDRSSSRRIQVGTLYLTATHTIFVGKGSEDRSELWVLHSLVCNVVKHKASQSGYPLLIHCKNFQVMQLIISQESDCHNVYTSLSRLSRPEKYEELYCFSFNPNVDKAEREHSWDFLDLKAEYSRMGLPNKLWHVTPINREYRVCDTYPADLFVPQSVTLPVIIGSSLGVAREIELRYQGQILMKCPFHREDSATICRSSQPLSGFSARCLEDEQMLQAIMKSNPGSRFMYVVDTRPKLNAMANRAAGKGYENEDNYCNIKFQFIGIENIHVMRNSQQKLIEGIVLIEKDWVSFGHKFSHRCGHLDGEAKEVSPVIDQFLDCLWQLMEQFPCYFEYNEKFLISIHNHIYSCHYGNFICNSQKERKDLCIKEKTHSIWPHLWENKLDFMNPLFKPDQSQNQGLLRPRTAPYCFKYWRRLYNRFDRELHPRQSELDCLMTVKEETQRLEEDLALCEQKLAVLDKERAKTLYMQKGVLESKQALWSLPLDTSLANTPQDYIGGFIGGAPNVFTLQQGERESSELCLFGDKPKSSDADNSDQESGVADFSSHSSGEESLPSEDSVKDPDSDETGPNRA
ncbi:myotubularin-related protein 7-like [Sinocyclocheilus grahami]|uniref:myotubularin-related protein 7-like n=1 Tax=Sinocyclocheilus grahami TaxID=75366 RepID=UPI0007AD539D|nr:PREDICTED: myotubularin-related protein 7-like [Sinocyclocheilus grahami]